MRSSIFVLAAAISSVMAQCDTSGLENCALRLSSDATACSDLTCACSIYTAEVACYSSYCPGVLPAELTSVDSICNGGSNIATDFPSPTDSGSVISTTADSGSGTESTGTSGGSGSSIGGSSNSNSNTITTGPAATGSSNPLSGGNAASTSTSKAGADFPVVPIGGILGTFIGILAYL